MENKSTAFKTQEELMSFILKNIPIWVRPKRKNKRGKDCFVNVFSSTHAYEVAVEVLSETLFKKLNNTTEK